jgi:Flp pilus assembly protein TadG
MIRRIPAIAQRVRCDASGLALLEFAFSLPLVLGIGLYGVETANLALANLRVSQVALNLADNASRVGEIQSNNTSQLREIDMNDVLTAAQLQGDPWDLTARGRIIVSSLEEKSGKQMIHWQRCLGTKGKLDAPAAERVDFNSHYGTTTANAGTDATSATAGYEIPGAAGMGPTGNKVTAPPSSGVMFVEINYQYKPVVSSAWLPEGSARIHYIASFIVRDKRVFTQIYNPSPAATRYTCNRYTET